MFSATIFPNRNGSLARLQQRLAASRLCTTMLPGLLASVLLTAAPAHASLAGAAHRPHRSTAAPRVEAHRVDAGPHAARRRPARAQQAGLRHGTRRLALHRRHPSAEARFADRDADPASLSDDVLDSGVASWYGGRRNGMRTSSGTRFDENALTAAHYWLPLGTRVRVTLQGTDESVLVTITDRQGTPRRAIDLSKEAARQLGILGRGTARVTLTRG